MADNPLPDSAANPSDLSRVQEYQRLVLEYETLDEEIDRLLALHQGITDRMSKSDLDQYRAMARRRDDLHNRMRELEQQISLDDDTAV